MKSRKTFSYAQWLPRLLPLACLLLAACGSVPLSDPVVVKAPPLVLPPAPSFPPAPEKSFTEQLLDLFQIPSL